MISSSSFLVLFVFLVAASSLGRSSPEEQLQGKFDTRDGSRCVWFELRKSKGAHVFVTACHCKDGQRGRQSFSCEYEGPVENCDVYQRNPKEFYNNVATALQRDHDNPCEPVSISAAQCPYVTLQRSKGDPPSSPCVPENKQEL